MDAWVNRCMDWVHICMKGVHGISATKGSTRLLWSAHIALSLSLSPSSSSSPRHTAICTHPIPSHPIHAEPSRAERRSARTSTDSSASSRTLVASVSFSCARCTSSFLTCWRRRALSTSFFCQRIGRSKRERGGEGGGFERDQHHMRSASGQPRVPDTAPPRPLPYIPHPTHPATQPTHQVVLPLLALLLHLLDPDGALRFLLLLQLLLLLAARG
jgi:hypothetical protein